MNEHLKNILLVDVLADVEYEDERRILATVAVNRVLLTCEIVRTLGGYVIKLFDGWTFKHEGEYYISSKWKYADIPGEDGVVKHAVWLKQDNNYVLKTSVKECNPMVRWFATLILGKGCKLHFSDEKNVEDYEFDMPDIIEILNSKSEDLPVMAIELLSRVCNTFEISEKIARQIG